MSVKQPGWIVVLNGAPRSGKSSIAKAIQERSSEPWINLCVDAYQQTAPTILQPSIGLRPGGERPDLERHLPVLFAAFYESIVAHSQLGLNVVVDIGHHEAYSKRVNARDRFDACCGQQVLERALGEELVAETLPQSGLLAHGGPQR